MGLVEWGEPGYSSLMTNDEPQINPVQRLRMTFSKGGAARFISHLDLARTLERALNRAQIPMAYTQGFNRRPRLSLAAALPLGYASEGELADIWLVETLAPEVVRERLTAVMAPGIVILSIAEIEMSAPSLQQTMQFSDYRVRFLDAIDGEALTVAVGDLLAARQLIRDRTRPKDKKKREYDLRPLVLDLRVEAAESGPELVMRLVQSPSQMGKPDEVLSQLNIDPLDTVVTREQIGREDQESG